MSTRPAAFNAVARVLNCPADTAVSTMSADNAVEAAVAKARPAITRLTFFMANPFKGFSYAVTTAAMCDARLQAVLRTYFHRQREKTLNRALFSESR